jgi:hypothetical protein
MFSPLSRLLFNPLDNSHKAYITKINAAIAIGPILQGLKKPVNDLSRGCTVEDIIKYLNKIIYTKRSLYSKASGLI